MSMITTTKCECCEDKIHNISVDSENVSYDGEFGFNLHLSDEELMDLYLSAKEVLLHS